MIVLYKNNGSPPARATMMLLHILGIEYEGHDINPIVRDQDTPEMTKKNPMRTIPFIDDDGFCLGDSHAIMLYLIDKYGKPEHSHLYPADKQKRATINQRLFFDTGVLFPRLRSVMALTYGGKLTELSKSMKHNIEDGYRILETYLGDTLFLADDIITLADISVITTISSLHGLQPIEGKWYPKLKQWYENMYRQEICRKINQPGAEYHVSSMKALMKHNKENQNSKL